VQYEPRTFGHLTNIKGLSREAIELHLEIYRGYVANVNQLLADCNADMRRFAFEYNGMVLHEQFFEQFRAKPRGLPRQGKFAKALGQSFASVESWKENLRELARMRGVGWIVCARDDSTNRIFNTSIELHHLGLPAGTNPVLVIDLWEHAWLKDYSPSARKDYVEAVLGQTDWQVIEKRCWTRRS